MRLRENRRFIVILLSFLALTTLRAQTLYWVNGSGNFNDPDHWSLTSGGASALKVPDSGTKIVFNDFSSAQDFNVVFTGTHTASEFKVQMSSRKVSFTGSGSTELKVSGDFFLSEKATLDFKTKLVFDNSGSDQNTLNFGKNFLTSDVEFISGNWDIKNLFTAETNTVTFISGEIHLTKTRLITGNIIASSGNTHFFTSQSLIRSKNKFLLGETTKFETDNVTFDIKKDVGNFNADAGFSSAPSRKFIGNGSSVNACGITLTSVSVTCAGSVNGALILNVDPTCATGIYTLTWNNPGPTGTLCVDVTPITQTISVSPSNYTFSFSGLPACPFTYDAQLVDAANNFYYSNSINIPGPGAINLSQQSLVVPTCFGACDGSYVANLNNGNPPYNIILTPSTGSVQTFTNLTTGVKTFTGLCAGLQTFSVTDAIGCSRSFSLTILQPAVLAANPVTSSITCIPLSNGVFAITPSGGNGTYTVNFSTGATSVTTGAGVSVTNLAAGPISATVTDNKGCSVAVNTTIAQPSASLTATSSFTQPLCGGICSGVISATAAGGTPPYQYNWSVGTGTTPTRTGLCNGTYTLAITDGNGCTNLSQTVTIIEPSGISLATSKVDVVCNGSCTGVASATASGGTGTFNYTWIGPVSSNTLSSGATNSVNSLCTSSVTNSSSYTVVARDQNNCTRNTVVTINQTGSLSISVVTRSITCFGANNGGATVTASGGNNGPFTYTWAPGVAATSSAVNSLPKQIAPTPYTVTAFDASLCAISSTFAIQEPAPLTPNLTSFSLQCNGICSGSITGTPSGGIPPYSYTLVSSTSTAVTTATALPFSNLCAANYTVTMRDNSGSGCLQSVTFTNITQPAVLQPSVLTTSVSCNSGTNGALTGNTGNGGTGPYTTYWSSISGTNSANPLTGQPAGSYTFNVIDSHSCTASAVGVVAQPSVITMAVSSSSISCFSVCNGVLTSTVSGGVSPYTYSWTNSSGLVSSAATATGLCPGQYTLTVTDFNLCSRSATTTVLSPSLITSTVVTTPVACFGNSNGSATITVGGGVPSFTFSFNSTPTVSNTTGILVGQPTGTYIATVTDNNNCVHTKTLSIATPTALAASITGTGSCNVCSGSTTLTPSFGTAGYTYSWTSSLGGSFPATATLSNLCPGTYSGTVTDSKGCTVVRTITLTQIISVNLVPSGQSILCFGNTTGSAAVTASGGSGVYTYSWNTSPVQTSSAVTNVGAGTYTVRVTDNSSPIACSQTAAIILIQPSAVTINFSPASSNTVSCYGFTNGIVSATVTGGTPGTNPNPPYTYTWSPLTINSSTNVATGLAAGIYTLSVRDSYGCGGAGATKTVAVTQPTIIALGVSKVNPSGCTSALATGSIQAIASGGSGAPFGYTLNPGPVANTTGAFTGLGGGAYSITARDAVGCLTTTLTTLTPPSAPSIAFAYTPVACYGYSTGVISATATGASASSTFNFTWSPSIPISTTSTTTRAASLTAGIYVVTAQDLSNGCINSAQATLTSSPDYSVIPTITNLNCFNAPTGAITVSVSGGSPAYTYTWLPSGLTGSNTATVSALPAGVYTLNLNDTKGCVRPYTYTVTQPASITVTGITSNLTCYSVCAGAITASASGGAGFISYSWAPVAGSSSVISNLCATSGTTPIIYTVTAVDGNTCSATRTFVLTQPSPVTASINILSATCSNSCNAIATQTASGGTPGYSYSWSSSTVTTSSLGSLCAGVYTAYVADANNCFSEKQFTVAAPAPLSVTLTPSNPLCNSACNGSIAASVSGAQGAVSYSWSPSGIGQNPTGLCATPSGTYTLIATDANGCVFNAVTTLTNPPALVANVSFTNPLCSTLTYTTADGSASASALNAFGALTYTWLPTGPPTKTTQAISGLGAGGYSLFIRDANSCQASTTFTLNNPPTFSINTIITPASCSQANGSITAIASGGSPGTLTPYTYSWTGSSSTSSVLTGITAGVYTVQVSDSHACTATLGVSLSNQNGPSTMPVIITSITCNAQCTGAASVDVSNIAGGTAPYTATWTTPSSTNIALTNLCAGSYVAQIVDATGCIGFTTAVISEPPPIIATPSISLPLCPGICNGSITVGVSGGNTPYVYSWIGTSSTNSAVTNLCAGDYTFIVEYNGVCTDTTKLNLPDQSSLTIVPSVTNVICYGASTGKIDLTITGGTPPYSAGWNNSNTGYPLINVSAGSYTAIITDNNGCSNTATASLTQGNQIISTAAITSPSCGLCNGTASVTAAGGTGPFTYAWSTSATGSLITNVCAGIYQVTATDNLSCSQTNTVIVNNSNGITGENFDVQNIPCSGSCVGAATVTPVGGTAPVSFSWINPASTSSVINNLCPGTYFVQMSDAQSCIRIASVTINSQISLTVSPFVFLPFCAQTNGSISIAIAGGTPSYNVVWNPPAGLTTSITNLDAGVYSYTVTESGPNACSVSNTINLSNTNAPVVQGIQSNINCFNACTGSISTSASSTNTPLAFLWSNASTLQTVSSLCKGPITLTVTDFGGCKTIQSFTITDNPLLQLGFPNVHNSTCFGDCNGSVNLVPNGGIAPYTYSWSLANANANPITSLCDGIYTGTVTDSKGCTIASPAYTIMSASALSLTANTFSSSCSAVADGAVSLTVAGGQPEYTYLWNGPSDFTSTAQNINNIFEGTYSVNVLDNLGCSKNTVVQIVSSLSVSASAGDDKVICPGTGSVLLQASSSSSGSTYRWYAAEDVQKTTILATGDSYLVKSLAQRQDFVLVASSSVASCYSEDQVSVGVFDSPPVDAGRDNMIPIYSTVTIGGHPSSFSAVSLTWSPAMYLDDASAPNPVASNTIGITYTLTVTDGNGCMSSDTVQVNLYPELNITSGFTPNGDGKNDAWIIDYIDQFPATTVDIFNRWGDSVFSSTGYAVPFDGKYKGAELPVGTYYYVIKLNHPGYPKPITGPLTIFR